MSNLVRVRLNYISIKILMFIFLLFIKLKSLRFYLKNISIESFELTNVVLIKLFYFIYVHLFYLDIYFYKVPNLHVFIYIFKAKNHLKQSSKVKNCNLYLKQ